ncbi:MAG: NADH-quinone oxidoreductase subunit C, partial [Burkholderiales bacterium]
MSSTPTSPTTPLETLEAALRDSLGDAIRSLTVRLDEITVVIDASSQVAIATRLRDDPALRFDMLIDLCGVDYRDYGDGSWSGPRFAVVMHLLSVAHNWRLRVRSFCTDDEFPIIDSVTGVWPSVAWFEREAFDLFGIVFEGHADLRRILTDYGFVGHPFRKD